MAKSSSSRGRPSVTPDTAAEGEAPSPSVPARSRKAKAKIKPAAKPNPAPPKKRIDRRGAKKGQKGRGNKPFAATKEQRIQVEAMVAAGAEQWFIAELLSVSEDTLQRHFRKELDYGTHRALSKIGGSLIQKAINGDNDLAKFVMARIGGWKVGTLVENTGPNGGPIEYRNLSDKEVEARIAALMNGHAVPSPEG